MAGQERAGALRGEVPGSIVVVDGEVALADVRVPVLEAEPGAGKDGVHRGAGEADQRVLAHRHAHAGGRGAARLDGAQVVHAAVSLLELRREPRLHGGEQSHARPLHRPAQLGCRRHRHRGRLVDELLIRVERDGGRGPADAARIEDLVGVAAVGPADARAQRRLEEVESLEEEGPLLGKEGLEGAEVQHPLVRLHLAEVRVDGADQRQIAGEVVAEVQAHAGLAGAVGAEADGGAAAERRGGNGGRWRGRGAQQPRAEVGPQLERAHWLEPVDAFQQPEAAHVAGPPVGPEAPLVLFVPAGEDAVEVEPEGMDVVGDAHQPQRDAHFERPALGALRHRRVPGAVPVGGEVGVVVVERVQLHARGVDLEVVAGAAVERGVQVEGDEVALDEAVAAAEREGGRERVVALDADVDGLVVPENAEARLHRRRRRLVRVDLPEALVERGGLPGGLVHPAVEHDVAHPARRVRGAHEGGLRRQLLRRGGLLCA